MDNPALNPYTLPSAARLPLERVFVVKLTADAASGRLSGRVEHLLSGEQCDFGSARALLAALDGSAPAPGAARP